MRVIVFAANGAILKSTAAEYNITGEITMSINLGEKIRNLRKAKNISQEKLASYLGVSFQAVSKWENGVTMPDVTMIPALASFFEITTDELFDFNVYETEQKVMKLCYEAAELRGKDDARSEAMLREGLKQYPGNDIILNNLLYTMRSPERSDEVIDICVALIESTKYDDVKYDALRILAETYKQKGEYALTKSTIERIPELYFTKLELDARLLEGEEMYRSAWLQKQLSAESLVEMTLILAGYYEKNGDTANARIQLEIALGVVRAFKNDVVHEEGSKTFYDYYGREAEENIVKRLEAM